MTFVVTDAAPTAAATAGAGHVSDAVVELSDLAGLYRVRASRRVPVAVHDRSPAERALRCEVARSVLQHQLPGLVAELVAAAADDLSEVGPTDSEALADADLRVIEAVERCKAVLDGVALGSLARLEATFEAGEQVRFAELGTSRPAGWVDAADLTVLEVSTATGLGQQEVSARLDLATARTPGGAELRGRLCRGEVGLYRACTVAAEISGLPAEAGPAVVESTLRPKDDAPPSPTLFRQRLTRACLAADRDAALRRRRARRRRGAHARIDADGLGGLTVVNDADKVVAAMERADALARAARQAGDPRSLDVLRADVITDALIFGDADLTDVGRRPPAHVIVVVPVTTAAGLTDAPCEIPGHGPVSAEQARQIMLNPDSTWSRLLVEASTGVALRLETTAYRPSAAIRAHVEAVDGTCRGPGCTVPASRCDLDHDIPWPQGATVTTNLTSKHRQHHNLHTHGHWQVARDPVDHAVEWRTAAGRRYTTHPRDWLEPLRDAPPVMRPHDRRPPAHESDPPPF